MSGGNEYVVAAYAVIWVVLLLYVVVIGARTARLNRDAELLTRLIDERGDRPPEAATGTDGE
ncbi:MAG: CcmD family protein [Thermoleophilia bacterium]|nr:CcmD family protein [Thermoleophilia bacterium]